MKTVIKTSYLSAYLSKQTVKAFIVAFKLYESEHSSV